jgi:homoserine O-acetyltransferase/O-succinyltransferase
MSAGSNLEGRLGTFRAGDVVLENGKVLKDTKIVYEVHGSVNKEKSNVILHPTSYGAQHTDLRYRIGPGNNFTLDTSKYCVVVVNLLGNGASTSPSQANGGKGSLKVHAVFLCDFFQAHISFGHR